MQYLIRVIQWFGVFWRCWYYCPYCQGYGLYGTPPPGPDEPADLHVCKCDARGRLKVIPTDHGTKYEIKLNQRQADNFLWMLYQQCRGDSNEQVFRR